MHSSISSLPLVTKYQFTNNMFIYCSFNKRESSSFGSIGGRVLENTKIQTVPCKYHIFQMEELPTGPEVPITNIFFIETIF